jgi:zinc D-Ala-D-Ala carboxypeptidase
MIETKKFYKSVADFDKKGWRWPHFSPQELACKCNKYCQGEYFHDPAFLDALEKMRMNIGAIVINSARRCPKHNEACGGAPLSMHKSEIAIDVKIAPHNRVELYEAAVKSGFRGMGFGVNFLHLDLGKRRRWDYPGGIVLWKKALGFNPIVK